MPSSVATLDGIDDLFYENFFVCVLYVMKMWYYELIVAVSLHVKRENQDGDGSKVNSQYVHPNLYYIHFAV
jgi:hypothetical protein